VTRLRLTHIAHEQCDAWTGLAAAGDVDAHVVESIWRTSATAGVLQRQIGLAPAALGFTYDTGLYLQLRAADADSNWPMYAAAACAIRTNDKEVAIAGATPLNGRHRPALDAMSPLSVQRLAAVTGT
jgi:hypothetical protein